MKALELLYQYQHADEIAGGYMSKSINEAIKELEAHITTLAVLQEENKALVKILTQMNEEVLNIKD